MELPILRSGCRSFFATAARMTWGVVCSRCAAWATVRSCKKREWRGSGAVALVSSTLSSWVGERSAATAASPDVLARSADVDMLFASVA